jgi:predicted acetyltransferase
MAKEADAKTSFYSGCQGRDVVGPPAPAPRYLAAMATGAAGSLQLTRPAVALVPSYLHFLGELATQGERVWPAQPEATETPEAFVARLLRAEVLPDPPLVPQTTFWATIDEAVVGHIGLRHRLNAELAEVGGHIGYTVRPSYRGRGLAKEMLRQVLRTPKALEIGRLLLTCAPDNVASNRTILANGGTLERTIFVERIGRATNLYWITLES